MIHDLHNRDSFPEGVLAGPKTAAASAQSALSTPQPSVEPQNHQQAAAARSISHGNESSQASSSSSSSSSRHDGSALSHSSSHAAGRAISSSKSDQPLLSKAEIDGGIAHSLSQGSRASLSSQLPRSSNRAKSSSQMPGDTLHSEKERSMIGGECSEKHAQAQAQAQAQAVPPGKPEAFETKGERLKKRVLAGKGATSTGSGSGSTPHRSTAAAQLARGETAWAYTGGPQKWGQQLVLPKGSPVLRLASDFEQRGQYQGPWDGCCQCSLQAAAHDCKLPSFPVLVLPALQAVWTSIVEAIDRFVQLVLCSTSTACHMSRVCWRVLYHKGTSNPVRVQVKLVAILCRPWWMRG